MQYSYKDSVSKYAVRIRKPGFDVIELVYINRLFNSIPVAQQENKDGFGVPIYGRGKGSTAGLVSFDPALIRVDIGNARAIGEDVYDVVSDYQASEVGVRYPEILRFDGTDILMMNSWLFRRKQPTYSSSGIDALPVVDGEYGTSPDDESNGSIDFRARSVRTYSENGGIAINDESVAEMVKIGLLSEFDSIRALILDRVTVVPDGWIEFLQLDSIFGQISPDAIQRSCIDSTMNEIEQVFENLGLMPSGTQIIDARILTEQGRYRLWINFGERI
jgi:hypothetical protein